MSDEKWTRVAKLQDIPEGAPFSAEADDKQIVLIRIGGRVHACGGECTHYGAPLAEGLLSDHVITCPWHNARFDLESGKMAAPPALDDLAAYPVKIENGAVFVGEPKAARISRPSGSDGRTFVILGGGAAGNAAAETLRREGFAGKILMVSAEKTIPYDRTALSKQFLSGNLPTDTLSLRNETFYNELGIEFLGGRTARSVDPSARAVTFADGSRIRFDCLLLATGGIPRKAEIPGSQLPQFLFLRSSADGNTVREVAEKSRSALIVGTGFIGMEAAAALRKRELEVHVVRHEEIPMKRVFGERVGKWLKDLHEKNEVHFHTGQTIKEVRGRAKVQKAVLTDGTQLAVDMVLAGLGITPAVEYLAGTNLAESGVVPVNDRLQTRAADIFAAGDIALVPDGGGGAPRRIEHWAVAERQGRHAAQAMLGSDVPYTEVPFFWTRQFDISVKYIGFAEKHDQVAFRGKPEEEEFLAGYYFEGKLKAASAIGYARELIAVGQMIRKGKTPSFEQFQDESVDLIELSRKM